MPSNSYNMSQTNLGPETKASRENFRSCLNMFYDLNLPCESGDMTSVRERLLTAMKSIPIPRSTNIDVVGYDGVALNHVFHGKLTAAATAEYVDLSQLSSSEASYVSHSRLHSSSFTIFNRLTLHVDSPNQYHHLHPSNSLLSYYDIIAVCPGDEALLHQACEKLQIDIISVDLSSKAPFRFRTKTVGMAIENDPASRRNLISNAMSLVRATKGRNVIISSGACTAMELRGPYDVINLATLFNLDPAASKMCISSNCRSVISHGEAARRSEKSIYKVELVADVEHWKISDLSIAEREPKQDNKKRKRNVDTSLTTKKRLSLTKKYEDSVDLERETKFI